MDVMTGAGEAHRGNGTSRSALTRGVVHVWRIPLHDGAASAEVRPLLSPDERERADRFFTDDLRNRYTLAHGWLRRILSSYARDHASALRFDVAPMGKPALVGRDVEFNLSHSGDIALVAVSVDGAVGVDVERWKEKVEYRRIAERFFSAHERRMLRDLEADAIQVAAGFYAAWTRKEAYLKARGDGISRGLHHFDVTLAQGEDARLIADRLDEGAPTRWAMAELDVGEGYSGAIVAEAPLHEIVRFDVTDYRG